MKERILGIVKTYCLFVAVFVAEKPLFMLFHSQLYADATAADWLGVVWHGLPLDLSLAGYLTVVPALLYLVSVWKLNHTLRRIWCSYFLVVSVLLAVIFTVDVVLYEYWGFRLDATPLFYFFSSPADTMASATPRLLIGGVLAMALCSVAIYGIAYALLLGKRRLLRMPMPRKPLKVSLLLLLLTALLFIPIRGGFTVSTMNVGKVYFSPDQRLNHAAINPAFSLMESLAKQKDFSKQYRFMSDEEAERLTAPLIPPKGGSPDTVISIITPPFGGIEGGRPRPDILFIILESFSSHLLTALGGEPDIAVELDSLCREGILFTNFYANSFRTDRGLVSILSGYPAQPTTSIMKYPRKTQNLPSISRTLRRAGYRCKYYYGGDADFTNMRSYLVSSGFEEIVSDQDFPVSERLSKWGVHDHLLFRRLLEELKAPLNPPKGGTYETYKSDKSHNQSSPFGGVEGATFRVVQTSSSHEPFDVPYHRLQNERLNAFAYTDSCLGDFIRQFRRLPQWKNTLVVLVPDHLGCYPQPIDNLSVERYQIPLLMIGGVVGEPRRIDTYGSQQDIAATLLSQLGLPHDEFIFSKDMLDPAVPHFAFFTVPDAFGMVTEENRLIYDCQSSTVVVDEGTTPSRNLPLGKAYLQKLYDDLAKR